MRMTLAVFKKLYAFPGHHHDVGVAKVGFAGPEGFPDKTLDPVTLTGLGDVFLCDNNTKPA